MASIRATIQRELFQPSDERIISLISVSKPQKKKKKLYFLAIVLNDAKKSYCIYLIKKTDQYYKKHTNWLLTELRVVDGKSDTIDSKEFELQLSGKQTLKWIANTTNDKLIFIQSLSRLSSLNTSLQKISFINVPKEMLSLTQSEESVRVLLNDNNVDNASVNDYTTVDEESYQALTAREESDLERLMSQCEFTIHNAEAFTEKLSREVSGMDSLNIQNIMASEQRVLGLMKTLSSAVDETIKLEQRISHYENLLKSVRDVVLQVEQKEAVVQTQNDNNRKLMNELESLITELDFPKENEDILLDGDLTTQSGIIVCISAANVLQNALNANIHASLSYMSAVQEQKKSLERTAARFSSRLSHHLNNLFSHLNNQFGDDFLATISREELTLATHSLIHSTAKPYSPLVKWLRINDFDTFLTLLKNYKNFMSEQYGREFSLFFELAKERLSGGRYMSGHNTPPQTVESKRKTLTSQDTAQSRRGSSSMTPQSAINTDYYDTYSTRSSEISLSEWEEFDSSIDRMLAAIDPVCHTEQQFCIQFFDVDINSTTNATVNTSSSPSPSNQSQSSGEMESKKSDHIRTMMSDLFCSLEPEFINFALFYDKIDGLYSMYLLVRLTHHVLSAQDTASFLSKAYGNILIQVKRNFDRFMLSQQTSIEEAKAPKRPKCGVLPFIKKFEVFAKQAENIFKSPVQRRADIDRWYTLLVRSMFESINKIANEHHKTPTEMIKLENYHYLHNALSTLKISCLENERKEAKSRYNEALKVYVSRYFGRPLEKLNIFFEGVQQKVAQGVKEEEIGYQLAFSKQELRKIIKDCNLKEVKKGLEEMYKKVEKHAFEPDTNLIQVIWRSMQGEFITQYKAIQDMIERCYPYANITLSFTIDDVLGVFSEIALTH